jgi:hypothetical protein
LAWHGAFWADGCHGQLPSLDQAAGKIIGRASPEPYRNWLSIPRTLARANDQAQRRGDENDPNEQRAFDDTCCVKHDTGIHSEQRAQTER